MALAITLFIGPLISSEGMADGRQQGEELHRPAVLHRRAAQQPHRPQTWMAAQTQKGLRTAGVQVLGVMRFIGDQHRASRGQLSGQPRPAEQLQLQLQSGSFLTPMAMQTRRGHHHDAAVGRAHHRPGCGQRRERFAQAHGVSQHCTTTRQQPASSSALVGEQLAAIRQRLPQLSQLHQVAVGRQGRQGLLQPAKPTLQLRLHRKAAAELMAQHRSRLEGKLPTTSPARPLPPWPHSPQLGLGDRIKRELQLNATRLPQPHQAAHRGWRSKRRDRAGNGSTTAATTLAQRM